MMRFEHRDGEDAAGTEVSVAPHLKPEVETDGTFSVDEDQLLRRGIDPEATEERLTQAGHTALDREDQGSEEAEDVSDADSGSEDSEAPEDETGADEDEGSDEAATKTDLMNLKKDELVTMAESFDDIDTDQNKEPLAEDLAGRVQIEGEE